MADADIYLKVGTLSIGESAAYPIYCTTTALPEYNPYTAREPIFVPKEPEIIYKTIIEEKIVIKEVQVPAECTCGYCRLKRWIHKWI